VAEPGVLAQAAERQLAERYSRSFEGGLSNWWWTQLRQTGLRLPRIREKNRERDLLLGILQALHARPAVAGLVVLRLSSDPILDPLLAERLLLTLAALGVPKNALPKTFQRAMGVILEMILTVSARSKPAEQKSLSAQMNKAITALPSTEFPNLTELREALLAETAEAGASELTPEVAALYADRLIAALNGAAVPSRF